MNPIYPLNPKVFSVVDLIHQLTGAGCNQQQAEVIAGAIETIEINHKAEAKQRDIELVSKLEKQAVIINEYKHVVELQQHDIQTQQTVIKHDIDAMKAIEPVTKGDLHITELKLFKEIEVVRKEISDAKYDSLRFIVWTGIGVTGVILAATGTLIGLLAKGFHWW